MPADTPIQLESLLHRCHPRVYRIAVAICGDRDAAERVVERVILRSGPISGGWKTDADADRWFVHYTVLWARECRAVPADQDLLWNAATSAESAALIAAIRHLPMQQREAFLLHHGEQLELRQLATAMDCSSAAAANHLASAVNTLRKLTHDGLADFTDELPAMMQQLVPAEDVLEFQIRQLLGRRKKWIWTGRILKWLGWIVLTIVVFCAAWILGRIVHEQI